MIDIQIILTNVAIIALCVAVICMRKYMIAVNDNIRYKNTERNPFLVQVTALGEGGAWVFGESAPLTTSIDDNEIDIHAYNLLERVLKEGYSAKVELDNEGYKTLKLKRK